MRCTLATSCCLAWSLAAEWALLKGAGSVHDVTHVAYGRSRSSSSRLSAEPPSSRANELRFVSPEDGANAEMPYADSDGTSPAPNDADGAAGGNWIDPPPIEYTYPIEDYLVIPNTRRYCEGGNILLATAAKSVGGMQSLSPPLLRGANLRLLQSQYKSAHDAGVACSARPDCTFVSSGLSRRIGLPIPTTFQDDLLPGTGASW